MWAVQIGIRSDLAGDELKRVAKAWETDLKRLIGLVERYAVVEPSTGEFGLLLFFQTRAQVEAFLASADRKDLARRFHASEAIKLRRYEVLGRDEE